MNDDLLKQLDACRAGEELAADEQLAELRNQVAENADVRELLRRAQELDQRFQRSIRQDVEVPSGLESRVLLALESANEEQDASAVAAATAKELPEEDLTSGDHAQAEPAKVAVSRRRWLGIAGVGIAAAASIAAAVVYWQREALVYSSDEVAEGVYRSFESQLSDDAWRTGTSVPAGFAVPETWIRGRSDRWQTSRVLGHRAIVHEIQRGGTVGYLYVLDCRSNAPVTPPQLPQRSGVNIVSVWQSGESTYALVVAPADYRALVRFPSPV